MQSLEDLGNLRAQLVEELERARNLRETVSRDLRLGRADATQMAAVSADVEARELEIADVDRQIADAQSEAGQARRARYAASVRKRHRSAMLNGDAAVEAARYIDAHFALVVHQVGVARAAMTNLASAGYALVGTVAPDRLMVQQYDPALAASNDRLAGALAVRIHQLVQEVPGLERLVTVHGYQYAPGAESAATVISRTVREVDRRLTEYTANAGIDVREEASLV